MRLLHLFLPSYFSLTFFFGSGSCGRNLKKARISDASQIDVTLSAAIAKDGLSTASGEVVLVTITRNAPIKTTFAKYENMARAITAIGSRFLEILETKS